MTRKFIEIYFDCPENSSPLANSHHTASYRQTHKSLKKDKKHVPIFAVECKTGTKSLSKRLAYFAERTDIPCFYQVHTGQDDYEIADLRVRVLPFTRFTEEVLQV
ncbi:MAG: hypothetical protein D3925_01650 [Candidatus Electrothrix sp. AR5]|nr:hypothetical protein [Candidatus Electrothrix sp. AR5]